MKKNIIYLFFTALFALAYSCGGSGSDDSDGGDTLNVVFKIADKSDDKLAELSADGGSVSVDIEWQACTWKVALGASSDGTRFISNINPVIGGRVSGKLTVTRITMDFSTNYTGNTRTQTITITNNKDEKISLTAVQESKKPDLAVKVSLDPSETYQTVTGFGGMAMMSNWSSYMGGIDIDLAFGKGNEQLGYNIMRVRIPPTKDGFGMIVPAVRRAKQHGALILASPWTPPAELKSTGSTIKGYLLPEKYADYAAYLKSFVDYMAAEGAAVDVVSVQNEPDWEPDYEGCRWNAQQLLDFVRDYGDQIGDAKLLASEAVNFKPMYTDPILNDPVAVNKLGIVGGHLYGGGLVDYPLAREKGKEIWMTEHLDSKKWDWAASLETAAEINSCMLVNFNAYIWWHIKRFYSMIGDGQEDSTEGKVLKRGYVMSHFAKYVTGATRIGLSTSESLPAGLGLSAYDNNGKTVVMIVNQSMSMVEMKIALGAAPVSVKTVVTTEFDNMNQADASSGISGNNISIEVAPMSLTTLIITNK